MQTASFYGFIRTLFYIIAFYYIFKFLAKLFLPLLLKKVVQKAETNFKQQHQNTQDNSWNKSQAEQEVFYKPPTSKNYKETKKVGDYVDYEEID
ncbi:hypothetical protein HNQ02_001065 [Flavobacterium sp. 7E]|uniref:DUF4834 family protein n=1 Tax=unclassified Flavobacterium TaxID=196869 RepID=UPI00156FA9CA|nr:MULTISPECIES: DUF4834 family protein [unclassified Flavobacterium]MBE0391352.1 hypothetical protein [Flavobacterium sp. PL002]NRS88151.1 hypothetical protein [Flavobacterium sp. 7E]NRT15684.1 hypothetical protein [Flavobacterium sp. 28A]